MLKAIKHIAIYEAVKMVGKSALMTYAKIVRKEGEELWDSQNIFGLTLLSFLTGYHVRISTRFSPFQKDDFLDIANEAIDLTDKE